MRFYHLVEGQIAVRLDWRHLPDLDDLMLDLLQFADDEGDIWWDSDEPSRFAHEPEPRWQWVKISPCWCGEHGWHWDSRSATDDLIGDRPRGRFIGLEWAG